MSLEQQYKGRRLIRLPAVETILAHRKTWVYKHIKLGNIPKPVVLSSKDVCWDESEILAVKERLINGTFGKPEDYAE